MSNGYNTADGLAIDSQSLDALRTQAKQAPDKALEKAAKQFEAVFMNMLMKSMRDATPQDGMFDSEQTKMFSSMLDQQLAQSVGGSHGIGLADMMVKQLSRHAPAGATPATAAALPPAPALSPARPQQAAAVPSAYNENAQQDFVQRMLPHAALVSRETGLPAHQMIGQAALESGWGRREILMKDGSSSHNLFGIKAGADWKGKVAEVTTTEYHHGVASKPVEKFRAYASYADSFRDYAKLLSDNPRYAKVLEQGHSVQGFAQALQQSGYATDPKYADKLVQVIGRVNTLA
jgi:flagellar protein FlgJ